MVKYLSFFLPIFEQTKKIYMFLLGSKNSGKYSITVEMLMQFTIVYCIYMLILGTLQWASCVAIGDFVGALGGATIKIVALGVIAFIYAIYPTRLGIMPIFMQVGLSLGSFLVEGFSVEIYQEYVILLILISISFSIFLTIVLLKYLHAEKIPEGLLIFIFGVFLFFSIFVGYGI